MYTFVQFSLRDETIDVAEEHAHHRPHFTISLWENARTESSIQFSDISLVVCLQGKLPNLIDLDTTFVFQLSMREGLSPSCFELGPFDLLPMEWFAARNSDTSLFSVHKRYSAIELLCVSTIRTVV